MPVSTTASRGLRRPFPEGGSAAEGACLGRNPLVHNALNGWPLWEASPLGDLTAEKLRPEAGLPQGYPLKLRQSDRLRTFRDHQDPR